MIGRLFDSNASRRQRRFLVLVMYFGFSSWMIILPLFSLLEAYDDDLTRPTAFLLGAPLSLLALVLPISAVFVFWAIWVSTQGMVRKDKLDERQRVIRNSAYRSAYLILGNTFIIVASYWLFATNSFGEGRLWLPSGDEAQNLFVLALLLFYTLPTALIAWNEPDPEEEESEMGQSSEDVEFS